ncbi:MAG: alpha/beta hydrolase [Selenomonadaceae bacterium]|nr:alpha/beta hydrolase [Selenomonadaceae bacterium]
MKRSLKKFLTAALCLGVVGVPFASEAAVPVDASKESSSKIVVENLTLVKEWDKVFPKSDKVNHRKVTFVNRYGITLAADLYEPKNSSGKFAAIAVSGPFGAVKEQSSGLYAQQLAERGFLTIAFDPSFTGESGGYPRFVASPDINTEDFCAAVDFLSTLPNVDENRIGIIGICGWGGMALNAAAIDTRIKATAVMTMYDMSRVMANGYFDYEKNSETLAAERQANRENLNRQRTQDYRNKIYARAGGVPDDVSKMPQFVKDYYAYYKTKRGYHKRSLNSNAGWNVTSALSFTNMPLLSYVAEIKNPVLIVHGENAHSRYFSETAIENMTGTKRSGLDTVAGNKELLIIPGANHVDLYDNLNAIPFDKIEKFFAENL